MRRNKDTLALGNMTGAMVFQSSFPVGVGLLLTPWRLSGAALVAAVIALAAGTIGISGSQSIVQLTPQAETMFADLESDGMLSKKNIPPSPNQQLLDGE